MTKTYHRIILSAWAVVLISCVVIFWGRLFPSRSGGTDPASAGNAPPPVAVADQLGSPPTASAQERLQQAIKACNPAYTGGGQFVERDGKILIAVLSNAGVTDLTPLAGLQLEALDISDNPLTDISPLKGLPLHRLGLEGTKVADLTPLAGMPLTELYMNRTPVHDLSPLKGMHLQVLNLLGTGVEDLSPLAGMPLQSLWLNGTGVKDISPLRGCPLVSLTLERTRVADLAPLAGGKLERLHIGQTPVTDLTPLGGLSLTRLIFTPANITRGLELVQHMTSIRELGTSLEDRMPPTVFWRLYSKAQQ